MTLSDQPRPGLRDVVDDLLDAMTLDEKLSFVHGATDPESLGSAGYVPGVPRLGVPPLRLTDGPAGVRVTHPATAMPAPIALASTFDPALARRYGEVIGRDGRALGQDVLLSPMVNVIRVPTAGRNFETFSEDPLVSARMVAEEIRGIQDQGLMATVKHLAANNQEQDRMTVDARVGDQALHEIELPGFEAAVEAGAASVMGSYNKVNGEYGCGSTALLTTLLRERWDFRGWVMSDWFATHSTDDLVAGLDQEMPGGQFLGEPLKAAIEAGTVPAAALDGAVRRILGQMAAFGLLACASATGPVAGGSLPPRPQLDTAAGDAVAQQVAEDGAVLLKNTGTLPLTGPAATSIAVVGTPASSPVIGGGGSSQVTPSTLTNPLDSIRERAGSDASVTYSPGVDTIGTVVPGATGTGPGLSGGPIDRTGDAALPPGENLEETRTLTVVTEGDYLLNLGVGQGLGALSVDGVQVAGGFALSSQLSHLRAVVHLTPGEHAVTIGAYGIPGFLSGPLQVRLSWVTPEAAEAALAAAVEQARAAAVAVVFAYDDGTEGVDRPDLALPFGQDALVSAVAAANPDTVVVLNTGSSVTMPWLDAVRGVLELYYPGQLGGPATARLLFGDVNPSGRLTQTFPVDEATTPVAGDPDRYPGVAGVQHYSEGILVGYRWYDAEEKPALFPFGHGLSYTTFAYRDLDVRIDDTADGGGLTATVTVENTGRRAGQEVVQVYVGPSPDVRDAQQAVRWLGGWTKVRLEPGETRPVAVHVGRRQLEHWDAAAAAWAPGTGTRPVWAGPSSRELPLRTTVHVHP